MLHGASEKVASFPAAEWLRAPLAHLPKDGGDIDSGKPSARPVYRPDVYARMVWWGGGGAWLGGPALGQSWAASSNACVYARMIWRGARDSRSGGLRLGRVGQRHPMHAFMRGWFGGGRGIRGLPVCAWAELGSVIQCMRLSADGLVGGGGTQDGSLALGWSGVVKTDAWAAIGWMALGKRGREQCRAGCRHRANSGSRLLQALWPQNARRQKKGKAASLPT